MNVCLLYYEGFCEFEAVFAANEFRDSMFSAALENRIYISEEKQKLLPDKVIEDINPEDIDLFIIPGGESSKLYEEIELKEFVLKLNEKNKLIAGICGGAELMAYYGLLDNKKANGDSAGFKVDETNKNIYDKVNIVSKDVVKDGNCITAIGKAYVEFAIELGKVMKIFKNEQESIDEYNWLKNIS
jgi:putative intracellular protease/amidase